MQFKFQENTYLSLEDDYGNIRNEMMFIVAKSGYGKGLYSESIIEEFHKAGYVIINIADPKDELELAYAMFQPKKPYHVRHLKIVGKKPESKKVKIYHPLTFNIPQKDLPEINFYSIPLKTLGRKEWSMIAESAWDTDTIKLLLNASQNISKEDGLHGFVHYLQDIVRGKHEKRKIKADWRNFGLETTGGTMKSIQDISNYLQPFKKDYFFSKETSPFNLDWKKILRDQENYHVFVSCYIKDPKIKEFIVLSLFNKIVENKQYATRPILIFIPEIRFLTPFRPEGYQKFLAQGIKDNLSMIRSMGKGMSALFDTQVFKGVDEDVRNSATKTFLGELGGASDAETVAKALNYKRDIRKQLTKMEGENHYLVVGNEDLGTFRHWMPSHRHCEPEYNFFEQYKEEFPDKMKNYKSVLDAMRADIKDEQTKIKLAMKKRDEEIKKQREEEQKEKEEKNATIKEAQEQIKKAKEIVNKTNIDKMKILWDAKQKNPELSHRELGKLLPNSKGNPLDHHQVKKYLEGYEKILEQTKQTEDSKDYEEKVVEELNKQD